MIWIFAGDYNEVRECIRILQLKGREHRVLDNSFDTEDLSKSGGTVICYGSYRSRTMAYDFLLALQLRGLVRLHYLLDHRDIKEMN